MPASGVRTHTTARFEFDRDTYTPCTSEELPSLAVKDAMIADRSDLVAGLADVLLASVVAVGVTISPMTVSAATRDERNVTPMVCSGNEWPSKQDDRPLIDSPPAAIAATRSRASRSRWRAEVAPRRRLWRGPAQAGALQRPPTARNRCPLELDGGAYAPSGDGRAGGACPASAWRRSRSQRWKRCGEARYGECARSC